MYIIHPFSLETFQYIEIHLVLCFDLVGSEYWSTGKCLLLDKSYSGITLFLCGIFLFIFLVQTIRGTCVLA